MTGVLIVATLLCSLVAGFLFAFAVVVMPGIGRLDDRAFLRGFQVIDGVIQRSQPLFVLVWVGSIVAVVAAAVLGATILDGSARWIIVATAVAYVAGVQLPTFAINVPLNNTLQRLDLAAMDDDARAAARQAFEVRWNRSNVFRTVVSSVVSVVLMTLLTAV